MIMRMQTRAHFEWNENVEKVKKSVLPFSWCHMLEEEEWTAFANAASNVDK